MNNSLVLMYKVVTILQLLGGLLYIVLIYKIGFSLLLA
jgi:hypothetical protein